MYKLDPQGRRGINKMLIAVFGTKPRRPTHARRRSQLDEAV
jgi:hypothetical protein